MAKCGAQTRTVRRCQRKVVTGTSRCPVHQGPWAAYGVAQRKEKEAKEKKQDPQEALAPADIHN